MNTVLPAASVPRPWRSAGLAVLPVAIAGAIASASTIPNVRGWYAGLAKPPFTPPNAVFGPAWTVLYVLMAFALWRILVRPSNTSIRPAGSGRQAAIRWFCAQIALNALWSVLFFGLHAPGLALLDVVLMDACVVVTIRSFARLDVLAASLLVPYAGWIAFATYLNAGIVWLNP